jgi:hypothetical protein
MQDVDKVAEKHELFDAWQHLLKQIFKLCPECSLYLRFCILNFGVIIVSVAVYGSPTRIGV